jgi:hypothetical protein
MGERTCAPIRVKWIFIYRVRPSMLAIIAAARGHREPPQAHRRWHLFIGEPAPIYGDPFGSLLANIQE